MRLTMLPADMFILDWSRGTTNYTQIQQQESSGIKEKIQQVNGCGLNGLDQFLIEATAWIKIGEIQVVGVPRLIYLLLWLNGIKHSKRYIANLCLNGHGDVNTNTPLGQWWLFIQFSLRNILIRYVGTGLSLQRVPSVSGRGKLIHTAALCG